MYSIHRFIPQSLIFNSPLHPNFHNQGATPAASLVELAAQADVLVTMLPATQHVTTVMEGAVLPNAK